MHIQQQCRLQETEWRYSCSWFHGSNIITLSKSGTVTNHTLQLAELKIHNLVTSPLFAWACWLCLGSLMVRQLRGHLGIALLQKLLQIVEGLGVLQVQPEIQKPSSTCSPIAAKSSSQLHDVQGLQPIQDPDALQAEPAQAEQMSTGKGACFEERAALPAG